MVVKVLGDLYLLSFLYLLLVSASVTLLSNHLRPKHIALLIIYIISSLLVHLVNVHVLFFCDYHSSSVSSYVADNASNVHCMIGLQLMSCHVNSYQHPTTA